MTATTLTAQFTTTDIDGLAVLLAFTYEGQLLWDMEADRADRFQKLAADLADGTCPRDTEVIAGKLAREIEGDGVDAEPIFYLVRHLNAAQDILNRF
ncbi:hypothetical protein ACPCSG_23720 [Streptomyces cellulosae]